MDPVHLHLMFNHLPIVGVPLVAVLLGWGLLRGSRELVRVAMGAAVVVAALSYPVFLTGEGAEDGVEDAPGFSERLMHEHEERAEVALIVVLVTGGIAAAGLLLSRKGTTAPKLLGGVTLAGLAVSATLLGLTGLSGGQIAHQEIRPAGLAARAGEATMSEESAQAPDADRDRDDDRESERRGGDDH
jgi:hypothetical protein